MSVREGGTDKQAKSFFSLLFFFLSLAISFGRKIERKTINRIAVSADSACDSKGCIRNSF